MMSLLFFDGIIFNAGRRVRQQFQSWYGDVKNKLLLSSSKIFKLSKWFLYLIITDFIEALSFMNSKAKYFELVLQ